MNAGEQPAVGAGASPVPAWQKMVIAAVGMALLLGWTHLSIVYGFPALWGPYAHALSDAGPLFFSRLGGMLALMVCPLMAIAVPLAQASTFLGWLARQVVMLVICAVMVLGHGYYLHHIVAMQGVENSIEFLAYEVGFESPADVPTHVKEALALSAKLADEGKAPWLPGQWREVAWPTIPAKGD